MPPEDTYTRRICAVLLADVSGFSALMGEDDERTARAVERLRTIAVGIVTEMQGRAEPVAGDALFATFDSVVAAVDAALQIQRQVAAEDFGGRRLRTRIGVHFGDLLLREGSAFGDAINIAARLQTLARPGTICISDGVHRHVRKKFDEPFEDLGQQRLKNISDPVHAYLIVPRDTAAEGRAARPRPAWQWVVAAALVAALGVASAMLVQRSRAPSAPSTAVRVEPAEPAAGEPQVAPAAAAAEDQHIALGVMLFKPLGGEDGNAWMREALRDGLNAQLSELSQVKVYSKEFLDFLVTRQGLSEIEAATKLGIKKMVSGSFVVVGGTLRIETHVVDVVSGRLDSSYSTVGKEAHFLDLQNQMVMGIISRLNLPMTAEEQKTLVARKDTNVEALRLLLEAEGGAPAAGGAPSAPGPTSALLRRLALLAPAPAHAEGTPSDVQAEILALLEQYRRATEAREAQALAAVYVTFPPEQQAAQQRYFDNVRDLKVVIDNVDVAVVGDEAVVSYTRTDDFADAHTGRPMHVSVRLTKILRRHEGGWRIAPGK
jgi:class 3 adenylate cyclase/ketosteroid isomerase-like protein/TolB-like protein